MAEFINVFMILGLLYVMDLIGKLERRAEHLTAELDDMRLRVHTLENRSTQ